MPTGETEPQRHIVIFDCNIYLDVACIVGPPFTWDKFNRESARLASVPLPHPNDRGYDSLRAIAISISGRFAGNETLEVWTNSHIDKIVRGKANRSVHPDAAGYVGLGWSQSDAQTLLDVLISGVISSSNGGTLGEHYPDGNPPLDYEDGMVYGACKVLSSEDPLARVYCVTRDKGFLDAYRAGTIRGHTIVLTPSKYVALLRSARVQYSTRRMRPPSVN